MKETNLPAVIQSTPVAPIADSRSDAHKHAEPGGHGEHGGEGAIPRDLKAPGALSIVLAVAAFVLLLVVLFFVGWIPDQHEKNTVRDEAAARSRQKPQVQFTMAVPSTGSHEIVLPCNVKANQATPIFTRTNGYLKEWKFDIGQHVKKGELMAEIDTPEVDAQLAQSKAAQTQNEAAVKKAEADKDLAQKTLDRYVEANEKSPGSVTKEAIDQNESALKDADAALNQAKANLEAARANVQQFATQVGFEKVFAPFSGTVTARNYDVGALLSPTNTSPGSEIFDLAQTDQLRVFVSVPQEYANDIKVAPTPATRPSPATAPSKATTLADRATTMPIGAPVITAQSTTMPVPPLESVPDSSKARLFIRNFPSKPFNGVITLTSGAVDPNTRTLNVQIDFANKDGQLFAGEYGEVHLPVTDPETIGIIPTGALIFNAQAQGNQVAVVDDKGIVHMKTIKTGRDFGTTIEVTSGISNTDKIITNPSERVSEGAEVEAHQSPNGAAPAPATRPVTASR